MWLYTVKLYYCFCCAILHNWPVITYIVQLLSGRVSTTYIDVNQNMIRIVMFIKFDPPRVFHLTGAGIIYRRGRANASLRLFLAETMFDRVSCQKLPSGRLAPNYLRDYARLRQLINFVFEIDCHWQVFSNLKRRSWLFRKTNSFVKSVG